MKKDGFTLIEILIISICLFFIGQIGYKNYLHGEKESRDMQRRADIEELQRIIEHYYQDYWEYPRDITFGQKLIDPDGNSFIHKMTNRSNGIAEDMPIDPINKDPYIYIYQSKDKDHLTYKLCAKKQEISGQQYCFSNDKREQFKKDTEKLYKENP